MDRSQNENEVNREAEANLPPYDCREVYPPEECPPPQIESYPPPEFDSTSSAQPQAAPLAGSKETVASYAVPPALHETPPGYFESSGWGDEVDHQTNFEASQNIRAVMFENQRWYPMGSQDWSFTLPTERKTWSNGSGSRSVDKRPKFTMNQMWCIDRSEYPERCDEQGWTYTFNFTAFQTKDCLGSGTPSTSTIVRRRKWIAPVPVSLLRNVRNTAGQYDENVKGNSHVFIDNDDLVFDIVDTEEITPNATSTRGLTAHLTPGSIERKGFLLYEMDKMWCDLKNKHLSVYGDRKDVEPLFSIDLNDVAEVKRGSGASDSTFALVMTKGRRFTFAGLSSSEATGWYSDINNVVTATKNWETAGQVGLALGAMAIAALAAGAAGSASRRPR